MSKFEAPEPGSFWIMGVRSLSSSPPSFCFQPVSPPPRLWWFRGPAPCGLGPFPAPVPLLPLFVFVPAALLVACLAALVLEVSFPGSVSESSWETDFRGDEFEIGGALWCEKSFECYVSESSWENAFSGDKFVTGVATWNETDSLNSVWQSQKSNLPGPFRMKEEEQILKALSHQFWKDFCVPFFQASWKVELLIIFCNVAVLIVFRLMQVKVPVVGAETFPVLGELWEERKQEEKEEEEVQSLSKEVEERKD